MKPPLKKPKSVLSALGMRGGTAKVPAKVDEGLLAETRFRARILLAFVAVGLMVVTAKAGWVMVVPNPELEARSRDQFRFAVELEGPRGSIVDSTGRVLATTVNLPALYANPSKLPTEALEARVATIVAATGKSEAWVRGRFVERGGRKLSEVKLGDSLDPDTAAALVAGLPRDQMWLVEEPVRVYPGRELAAPLLGFTDVFGDGAAGLEKMLNRELAGDTLRVLQERDRKGRTVDGAANEGVTASAGNSVQLTLDASIQFAAERALDAVMETSRPEAAMAVVMDVKTGAILAIASRPTGNPNHGESRAQQELFKNRPAMDQIEPGSVFKQFIAAAAIEEGLITPDTLVDCELGAWVVGPKAIRDDHPKGVISATEVIKFSSNIGVAKFGFMLGAEKMLSYLRDFGFGRSTGLGIPGEVGGILRSAATIKPIELATTAFGQGITASPVQLAAAVATIANGGVRMAPRLVAGVLDKNGQVEMAREPRTDRRVISEVTALQVTRMMETVTEPGGTGTRAKVKGYRVAGKTGTAQKVENGVYSPTKRVSSFVGFLPADRPEVAIAVAVDSPTLGSKYGGIVSAPVFAEIGAFTMRYLGVAPGDDHAPPLPNSAGVLQPLPPAPVAKAPAPFVSSVPTGAIELSSDGDGHWLVPDLSGRSLRAAMAALQPSGLAVVVQGSGRVVAQVPPAGSALAPGDTLQLSFN